MRKSYEAYHDLPEAFEMRNTPKHIDIIFLWFGVRSPKYEVLGALGPIETRILHCGSLSGIRCAVTLLIVARSNQIVQGFLVAGSTNHIRVL